MKDWVLASFFCQIQNFMKPIKLNKKRRGLSLTWRLQIRVKFLINQSMYTQSSYIVNDNQSNLSPEESRKKKSLNWKHKTEHLRIIMRRHSEGPETVLKYWNSTLSHLNLWSWLTFYNIYSFTDICSDIQYIAATWYISLNPKNGYDKVYLNF